MTYTSVKPRSHMWKFAASILALISGAGLATPASAQSVSSEAAPEGAWDLADIIGNNTMPPLGNPPGGPLDNTQNLTGIGMMTVRANTTTAFTACTGTLINPRTVIFNAHCVNGRPASAYGAGHGTAFGPWATGTPIAFGFAFDNFPGVLSYFGLSGGGAFTNQTNAGLFLYNAEHVWYDPRSLAPTSAGFLEADIAIATLDTPAWGVPTWVMLFTPLQHETHAIVTGYGGNGTAASVHASGCTLVGGACGSSPIDFRRRAAENMISFLGSLDDRNAFLFAPPPGGFPVNPQTLYQMDFDSPAGQAAYNPGAAIFDFDLFDGVALPREGTTTGGDSGGPLIADQYFDTPVIVGSLSGGSRYHGGAATPVALRQRFAEYGTSNFYQPFFLFWDQIVANNPYVYAGNFDGDRAWTDPDHWVQMMDPAYGIEVDGELVNGLPGTPALGVSGATSRYGQVCFLATCIDNALDPEAQPWAVGTPNSIFIPGGPGSTDFVPNNIVANPAAGIRPRYYNVTLAGAGTTWLDSSVTIDMFTMSNGYTLLDIQAPGSLRVLGETTIGMGWLNVDGLIRSGEMLSVQGVITGTGTLDPTFFTSVAGAIAPNGAEVGTLTFRSDVILASGNQYFVEVGRDGADMLRILADPSQGTFGHISLGGDLRMVKASNGPAPRHGQVFTLVLADGTVMDTFDAVYAQTGILRPEIRYLTHSVEIELRAGKFADVLEGNVHELAFAHALDALREGNYNALYGLYGEMDVMDFSILRQAFNSLTPSSLFDVRGLMDIQSANLGASMNDRLLALARGEANGFSVMGSPTQVLAFGGDEGLGAAPELSFASMMTGTTELSGLPDGVTGFVSGGYSDAAGDAASARLTNDGEDAMQSWHLSGGIEQNFGALTLGIGAAYSRGQSLSGDTGATGVNEVSQTVLYGLYNFGGGIYVSGLLGAGNVDTETERRFASGEISYLMSGETGGDLLLASFEAGVNFDIGDSFMITPRVALRQTSIRMDAFSENGGETALAFEEQLYDTLEARIGAALAGDFTWRSGWRFTPSVDLAAVGNLSGDETGITARFIAAPDVPIYLAGAMRDDIWGEVSAGLSLRNQNTAFSLRVEQSVDREEEHTDRAVARFSRKF